MIFSTDRCPICSQKLELKVIEHKNSSHILLQYYCSKKEAIKSDPKSSVEMPHYSIECFSNGGVVMMIIPPFLLIHREMEGNTDVYSSERFNHKKLIFKSKLLDLDYSQPHVVLDKLKILVTFS